MLRRIINRFLRPRHYWRDLGFDELSELYTSNMFRSLAQSLVGIFIPIYLYQLNYAVWEILLFYAMVFSTHAIASYPVGHLIAKAGPKHTILTSYVFQVMSMLMLVSQPDLQWPLVSIAVIMGISVCLFFTAFNVDFSKIKHSEHGGKEVGWMYGMERLGAVLGPLIGGLVGYFIGAEYIFMVAIILLFAGIIPLFITQEPIALNQKLDFRSLKPSEIRSDLISCGFLNIENSVALIVWPLFVSVYVFSENPYAQLGSITSLSVLVSLFIARAIGRTIDKRKGRQLLHLGSYLNAALHLFRPFTNSYAGALGVNLLNEALTPAYRMPYLKGFYDAADVHTGKRIVYIVAMEVASSFSRAVLFMAAGLAAYFLQDSKVIFTAFFLIAAFASLGIMLERFKALDR